MAKIDLDAFAEVLNKCLEEKDEKLDLKCVVKRVDKLASQLDKLQKSFDDLEKYVYSNAPCNLDTSEMRYKIRKTQSEDTQIGASYSLEDAIKRCPKGYKVYYYSGDLDSCVEYSWKLEVVYSNRGDE